MDCAIVCMQYLLFYYSFDIRIITTLQDKMTDNGINLYDLIQVCNSYNFPLKAYYSFFLPKEVPCILYHKHRQSGHYYILLKKGIFFCQIYDPVYKEKTVFKGLLYLMYSHICVLVET